MFWALDHPYVGTAQTCKSKAADALGKCMNDSLLSSIKPFVRGMSVGLISGALIGGVLAPGLVRTPARDGVARPRRFGAGGSASAASAATAQQPLAVAGRAAPRLTAPAGSPRDMPASVVAAVPGSSRVTVCDIAQDGPLATGAADRTHWLQNRAALASSPN
jgi:hypothetical protein